MYVRIVNSQNCEISMIKAAISREFFLALHSTVAHFWKQWHQFMQRTSNRYRLPGRLNLIRMDTSKNELHHMKLQLLGIMDDWNTETIQRNLNVFARYERERRALNCQQTGWRIMKGQATDDIIIKCWVVKLLFCLLLGSLFCWQILLNYANSWYHYQNKFHLGQKMSRSAWIIKWIMGICSSTCTEWLFIHWNPDQIGI